MGLFGKIFGGGQPVAHFTWHASRTSATCAACRQLDGTSWVSEADFRGPPMRDGCTCPGGCTCRALEIRADEAWGPGNADWIRKRGGVVSGEQMQTFLSS